MMYFGLFMAIGGLFLMFWGLHYFGFLVATNPGASTNGA